MASSISIPESWDGAAPQDESLERPAFVSEEVWSVVRLAAERNKVAMRQYIEKALLDEALILEQIRFGRKWLVKDKQGNLGEVEFD